MRNNLLAILFILLISALASLPLLKPGLHQIHDDQQIARLYLFDQAIKAGQFPVRWVDELGFGFGYPLFNFYPPLVYFLGELFHLLGFGFIDSTKLVFATSVFASGIAMYIFARSLWDRLPSLVASAFYIFLPYRALDIYVRGALAESFSFVWLPLILWSFYKLITTSKLIYIFLSAIFLALLVATHNLIFLPFMLILPFYLLFLIFTSKKILFTTAHLLLTVALAMGLSAFFWIPALLEKKFTIVDELLLVNLASYNIHFVYPQQLWNWAWGFGGSAAGLADGISFKIGKLHVILSVAALILSVIFLLKNKTPKKLSTFNFQLSILFFLLFALAAFMTTFWSKPIWDLIIPLGYLQFPWRFLTATGLFASILAGYFIYLLKIPIIKLIFSLVVVVALIVTSLKLFQPQFYREDLTDEVATSSETINWDVSLSSFEYVPKGVPTKTSDLGTNLIDIDKSQIPQEKITTGDKVKIDILKNSPHNLSFRAQAKESSIVTINTFNFPGWSAKIDGQKTNIFDNNKYKLISLNIPKGDHDIKVEFKNTPTRTLANSVSIITVVLLLITIQMKIFRPTNHEMAEDRKLCLSGLASKILTIKSHHV